MQHVRTYGLRRNMKHCSEHDEIGVGWSEPAANPLHLRRSGRLCGELGVDEEQKCNGMFALTSHNFLREAVAQQFETLDKKHLIC